MQEAKLAVRSLYDAQKLRIEMSNRLCAQIRAAYIGPRPPRGAPDADEKAWEKKRKAFDAEVDAFAASSVAPLRNQRAKLLYYHAAHEETAEYRGVLSAEWAQRLDLRVVQMDTLESDLLKDVKAIVQDSDLWPWLENVKGCGPAMSGVLISELRDPARFATISKLWAYCGLHTIDGRAARRQAGQVANWNAFLKTKLIGVLGPSFLRSGSDYRRLYDDYRVRIENRPCSLPPEKHAARFAGQDIDEIQHLDASQTGRDAQKTAALLPNGCTKGHMHNKAIRYMVKMFLRDLLVAWCTVRKIPIRPSYAEEYLGKVHSA